MDDCSHARCCNFTTYLLSRWNLVASLYWVQDTWPQTNSLNIDLLACAAYKIYRQHFLHGNILSAVKWQKGANQKFLRKTCLHFRTWSKQYTTKEKAIDLQAVGRGVWCLIDMEYLSNPFPQNTQSIHVVVWKSSSAVIESIRNRIIGSSIGSSFGKRFQCLHYAFRRARVDPRLKVRAVLDRASTNASLCRFKARLSSIVEESSIILVLQLFILWENFIRYLNGAGDAVHEC